MATELSHKSIAAPVRPDVLTDVLSLVEDEHRKLKLLERFGLTRRDERLCGHRGFQRHIIDIHLRAGVLHSLGVPLYDIEVASVRGMKLDLVVAEIMKRIARKDPEIALEMNREGASASVSEYKINLVKTLRLIERHKLAKIDWDSVETSFAGASNVEIDPSRDFRDKSFIGSLRHVAMIEDPAVRAAAAAKLARV